MNENTLTDLKELAGTDFEAACDMAETLPAIADFFETWAKHCGAPRKVFIGHTVVMLVNLNVNSD